jgi:RNA polymerase sigma factor (sigma-70 family)
MISIPSSLNQLSDGALMHRFQCVHDEASFTTLVQRYTSSALVISRNYLKDSNLAEDAVQETFIRVVRNKNTFKVDKAFGPWFYKLLRNVCLDALRKIRTYSESLSRFEYEYNRDTEDGDGRHIHKVLGCLNEMDQMAMMLRVQQGMTYREIAAALGSGEDAVKKRCQRAASRLRKKYSPEEVLSLCELSSHCQAQ